jgi:CRP/FNR family transcriptional regulator, cyclic AMP receptor protein
MTSSLQQLLERHPFVLTFEPQHLARLARLAKAVHFDRELVIFHEGDEDADFYLVVKGMVAIEVDAPEHVLRVQTLFEGDEFGWSAVLTGRGKHFQARALEPTDTLAFGGADLLKAFHEDPAFGLAFTLRLLGVVSERLQGTRLQLHDMYSVVAKRAGA